MPVPDPARSRAVLIGIDTYTHPDLKPLPAAAAGARQLATLLRDPTVWGLPPEHVAELGAEASAEQILDAVYDAARHARDTVLVYFAGHGLRDRAERLYLALAGANADQPEIGTVHYRTLRNVLRQSGYQARYRITVLDCCYSGLAGAMSITAAPTRTDLARALDERSAEQTDDTDYGDCVLTSAPPTKPSFAPPEAEFPEFTGELIDILEHGITGAGPTLSLDDVWQRIWRRLRERGSPEPQQFAQNKVARQIRLRNRASAPGGNPSPDESALRQSVEQEITLIEQQAVPVPPEETTTVGPEPDPASRPDYADAPSQAPLPPSAEPPHPTPPATPTAPAAPEAHQAPAQTGEQPAPDTSESGPAEHHADPTPPPHGHTPRPRPTISRRHALLALTGTTLTAATTLTTWKILDNGSSGSHSGGKSNSSATPSPTRTPGKQLWA
ncbi:caspase family protein, partial [Streptomyces sp. NPDC001982]|uniref:caspase family protein n=1 Tax=Streptomyces sp. NPDC001982 TaxID=3154405 RepID=UPI003317E377